MGNPVTVVYDLSRQPFSIGDFLCFNEAAQIMFDSVDIVVSFDPARPVNDDRLSYINAQNVNKHLAWLLPAAQLNPALHSIRVAKGYHHNGEWPHEKNYNFYRFIAMFNKCAGTMPALKPKAEVSDWAHEFLREHGEITVQLRRYPSNASRDSDFAAWREFFRQSDERFVIVGWKGEADDSLRMPNVTFAQDYDTDTERGLALVALSRVHTGAQSGPSVVRWFNGGPFVTFNEDAGNISAWPEINGDGERWRLPFFNSKQSCLTIRESSERIKKELDACLK